MENIWDTIIIGGGPAGLTAGLYCARAGLRTLLLEGTALGGQLLLTDAIENYPGTGSVSGPALADAMVRQASSAGLTIRNDPILGASLSGPCKALRGEKQDYRARTVILAAGASPRKLGLPEETRLLGRGVSYCALCDGFFFRGKTVCVVGGGNSAVSEALYLAKLCRTVYVVHRRDSFTAQEGLLKKLNETPNIQLLQNRTISRILGEEAVRGIVLGTLPAHGEQTLPCDGLFIAIGRTPNTSFLPQALNRDSQGYVYADEDLAANLPGVFAAGDIRKKPLRQIVTAVSDGALAAASVEKYLKNP